MYMLRTQGKYFCFYSVFAPKENCRILLCIITPPFHPIKMRQNTALNHSLQMRLTCSSSPPVTCRATSHTFS